MVRDGGEIRLLGGDFEGSEVTTEAITYNQDPTYVYSGLASAHIIGRHFQASASAAAYDYPSWLFIMAGKPIVNLTRVSFSAESVTSSTDSPEMATFIISWMKTTCTVKSRTCRSMPNYWVPFLFPHTLDSTTIVPDSTLFD